MSSFGDGDRKTRIEEELSWIAKNEYASDFYDNPKMQKQFILDVLDVLRFMCEDYYCQELICLRFIYRQLLFG